MSTPNTPTEVMNAIKDCALELLDVAPDGPPSSVLIGPQGVTRAYGCCDLSLSVESLGPVYRHLIDEEPEYDVAGRPSCTREYISKYRVTMHKCAPGFDGGAVNGAPVPIATRNALMDSVMSDWWRLFTHMYCCITERYNGVADVTQGDHSLIDGCVKYWVEISWRYKVCC